MRHLGQVSTPASFGDFAPQATTHAAGEARLEEEVVGLFEQFRAPLLRYLMALGLNGHDAEEIVQDVFLALFRHLRQGKPHHQLRAWIFRVAHNLGLKQRQRARQQIQQTVIGDAQPGWEVDPGPNPEEQLLTGERQERLQAVLQVLPEKDRWCLYLRSEGLRYREIAEALDISLGSVSLSLCRSLTRLARVDGH
jgi:RNA polymerase sigma-70 factor (ECF subfamily)